jgi:hypothetical protein
MACIQFLCNGTRIEKRPRPNSVQVLPRCPADASGFFAVVFGSVQVVYSSLGFMVIQRALRNMRYNPSFSRRDVEPQCFQEDSEESSHASTPRGSSVSALDGPLPSAVRYYMDHLHAMGCAMTCFFPCTTLYNVFEAVTMLGDLLQQEIYHL